MKMHLRTMMACSVSLAWMGVAFTQGASISDRPPLSPDQQAGKVVYDAHCATCHGATGEGDGPAAVWLYPKPRNFSAGLFKIQSTPPGYLPTDEDLFRSITRGLPGTSMPGFPYLSEKERRDVVAYVKYLTAYQDDEGRWINRFEEARAKGLVAKPVEVPPEPPVTLESLSRGKELFVKMQCNTCHGDTGAGDGPQAVGLKDSFGYPALPRDFNTAPFKGGATGPDLYLRIHNGLPGTPMAPYGPEVLKPDERWALVHFIQSLRRQDVAVNDILAPQDQTIHALRVARVPTDPADPAWESYDPVRVQLHPLWPEPNPTYAVAVTALHDGKRLALLCRWQDQTIDNAPIRVEDFQDAVAVQFPLDGEVPFLGMGDAEHPVNIWQWKAAWQAEVEGARPDLASRYPSTHVDTYFVNNTLTAADAGNLLAGQHQTSVEDANARGFGTLTSQPPSGQNVFGRGIWQNGNWSVVFLRTLASPDPEDVRLSVAQTVPVAFAVWNGAQHDRNGRKMISHWFQLAIEP